MYKSDITSLRVVGTLALISLMFIIIVEKTKVPEEKIWIDRKLEAAKLMQLCEKTIKEYRLEKGVFIDSKNDPHQSMLIGQQYSLITTKTGDYWEAKNISLNPNFAAVIIDMMKECGLQEGDQVAVAFTGSFPALNIATLCAIDVMGLRPIIISSVTASSWGANDPKFTWLDMEKLLYDKKILRFRSVAASIGGVDDIGKQLSSSGRELAIDAIKRNKVQLIYEPNLEASIERRMAIYDSLTIPGTKIKACINVGGGTASRGPGENRTLIKPGVSKDFKMKNFPTKSVMVRFLERRVPRIHILNIKQLAIQYGLNYEETEKIGEREADIDPDIYPRPLSQPGEGAVFEKKKYNLWITSIALILHLSLIVSVIVVNERRHRLKK